MESLSVFLTYLLALGDKLPKALPLLKQLYETALALYALLKPSTEPAPGDGVLEMNTLSATEQSQLDQIAAAVGGDTAMVDLSFLLTLFRLAKQYPAVMLLLSELLGKFGG